MQTFLPSPDFAECAVVLDSRRLGKQIIESRQIWRAANHITGGWRNHPATIAWRPWTDALVRYTLEMSHEWHRRYGRVHGAWTNLVQIDLKGRVPAANRTVLPPWLGDEQLHASHRAALLAKDPAHYRQFGWTEQPAIAYVWPKETRHATV